ncbi:hypothetical protein LC55x_0234 [Lysobacter capsici]|nr:hypothetical protein LC55x_0234 [Lysobacter capsici]
MIGQGFGRRRRGAARVPRRHAQRRPRHATASSRGLRSSSVLRCIERWKQSLLCHVPLSTHAWRCPQTRCRFGRPILSVKCHLLCERKRCCA